MKLTFVESSNIIAVGYEEDSETLGIQFKGGKIYHYAGVPKQTYDDLINSDSIGRAFLDLIRHDYTGILQ